MQKNFKQMFFQMLFQVKDPAFEGMWLYKDQQNLDWRMFFLFLGGRWRRQISATNSVSNVHVTFLFPMCYLGLKNCITFKLLEPVRLWCVDDHKNSSKAVQLANFGSSSSSTWNSCQLWNGHYSWKEEKCQLFIQQVDPHNFSDSCLPRRELELLFCFAGDVGTLQSLSKQPVPL